MSHFTGTITVRGTEFPAELNADSGYFSAVVDGTRVSSTTWAGLASAVNIELRKREVTVSIDFVDPGRARRGNTTRLHASQRKPAITWADGTKTVENVSQPLRADTDTDELRRLIAADRAATRALTAFREAHRLPGYQLSDVVAEEIKRVIAERDAAERAEGAIDLDDNEQESTT